MRDGVTESEVVFRPKILRIERVTLPTAVGLSSEPVESFFIFVITVESGDGLRLLSISSPAPAVVWGDPFS